ncbi:metallophosphoesterase family protein [Cyanobacterium sp. IPPAS B-1200]|uniref:metallophosphoesterase family protein n=1 Tax=Cyanobacterium sp. IPPAS B-1200 TaxID=1562720 RepID=UPI00085249C4|nr:metallophosphoesterase [Cyanobacterium sp. IPPAS B-1200]OEJ78522.1 metallophosphoesterase [Cyanobacterium sp. IPPAS B-1200]
MKKNIFLLWAIASFCVWSFSSYAFNTPTEISQQQIYQPPRGDVRLLVISDLNSAYGSTEYEQEVHQALKLVPFWDPDVVLSGGDMIAGQKASLSNAEVKAMWNAFDAQIAKPLRDLDIPFGFTIGNHDGSGSFSSRENRFFHQRDRDLAKEYWQNHNPKVNFIDRTHFPFYYTFMEKDIFFLVWDASFRNISSQQLTWAGEALQSPVAKQAKMRIAIGHLPLYGVATGRDREGEVLDEAEFLQNFLELNDVHTYISGHHHAYYPAHKRNLQMLHAGVLGGSARQLIAGNSQPMKNVTVVDINFDNPDLTTYTTYDMKTLKIINNSQLPRLLMAHNGMILRRDVNVQNLSTSEKNACLAKYPLNPYTCEN